MIDIESKDFKYLKFLSSIAAENSTTARCKMAAVLVHKGIPVALGRNQLKSHPLQARFSMNEHAIFLHAEIDAIARSLKQITKKELSECTLYVCRVLKNGKQAIAKPCPGCQKALKYFGIKYVVWTTENGFATSEEENLNETRESYESKRSSRGRKINSSSFYNYRNANGA